MSSQDKIVKVTLKNGDEFITPIAHVSIAGNLFLLRNCQGISKLYSFREVGLNANDPAIWGGCVTRRSIRAGSWYPEYSGPETLLASIISDVVSCLCIQVLDSLLHLPVSELQGKFYVYFDETEFSTLAACLAEWKGRAGRLVTQTH